MTYEELIRDKGSSYLVKATVNGVEYDSSQIVDFEIVNTLSSDEFRLGTTSISTLTLKMLINTELPSNAKIVPYLALTKDDFTTDWMPLGEFYVDDRSKTGNMNVYKCLDKFVFADVPFISTLTYPTTQKAVYKEICDSLGYVYDDSFIDPAYVFTAGPAGFSKRQVLGYIASANCASLYFDKVGTLAYSQFSSTDEPISNFTGSDYMRVVQTNPLKTYTRVVVTYDDADDLYYEAGTGDENHTLHIENPFATQAMTDNILNMFNGFSYIPIKMDAKGFPHSNQGDRISFSKQESATWAESNATWDDADIAWDGLVSYQSIVLNQVLSFKGGLKLSIDSPSVSEQRSEFVVPNSIMQQVKLISDKATQDSVKLNKAYFGVNISREEGWIVGREDGRSRAVFNSDELTFYRGSEKAIYFDTVNDRYVFSGVVTASEFVGGVITGSLIRTSASSYPRVEISPATQLIEAAQSANSKVNIVSSFGSTSSPAIHFNNHPSFSYIYQLSGQFNVLTPDVLNLIGHQGVRIRSDNGPITVDSWSKFRSSANNQTLQQALDNAGGGTTGLSGGLPAWNGVSGYVMVFENGLLVGTA